MSARAGRGLGQGAGLLLIAALPACVMVPQTHETYDPDCRTVTRQMTLEPAVLGSFRACSNEGCAALLVAAGAVAAASLVISGSIVIVGNVAYWFERQGRCQRASP